MSKHRASHRTARRRRRVGALGLALGVTIAVGGAAVGVLPQLKAGSASADARGSAAAEIASADLAKVPVPTPEPTADVALKSQVEKVEKAATTQAPSVPADSGDGRRIVFSESEQQVWLIGDGNKVERTYPVSGSRFDNLDPGTYTVSSRSREAVSYDYSGKLEYFVRFATGFSEPIGFHAVPRYNNGKLEQTKAQLGTPLSAGCVRQWMPDAIALWDFAPIGTKVYVTA